MIKQKINPSKRGDLSEFYIRSGVRENTFCVKNPKYRMAPLPTSEARERAGLRGAGYRGPDQEETRIESDDEQKINSSKRLDLSEFYIRSGVRENTFCVKNPKYRMAPLPTSEARERAGLRGAGYRGPVQEEMRIESDGMVRKLQRKKLKRRKH